MTVVSPYSFVSLLLASIGLVLTSNALGEARCDQSSGIPGTERLFTEAWGTRYDGQRYQSARYTTINAENAGNLALKWVYGFATDKPRSYPLVTEDTLFIGDGGRGLVALNLESGCLRWENPEVTDIGSAIVAGRLNGRTLLVFTDRQTGVYAADAETGDIVWTNGFEALEEPMFSGSPLVHGDVVYVPLSSREIALSLNPLYGCCRSSGGMVALDLATGEPLWHRPTIEQPVEQTGKHLLVIKQYGPSGAPVWGAPTLDAERGLLFFGTGQNYSHPATDTSDAIFAVWAASGDVAWHRQFTAQDVYNMSCEVSQHHPNCPDPSGPDLDFGAPPIRMELRDGRSLLLAGQKSGDVYALNPDTGNVVWKRRFGAGGKLGGVHWGLAADPQRELIYVPISDSNVEGNKDRRPGLFALDANSGEVQWFAEREVRCAERKCWTGISAAISAAPGIVVAGGLDGRLEILHADTGESLWYFDTMVDLDAVNGVETRGGGIDAHGPMLADDLLIVSSGYGSFMQEGGNALLVFELLERALEDSR
ncbi:MAG: PQQ-binding-like beta-propeller repeat protein [Pseudomonadota bacterium]